MPGLRTVSRPSLSGALGARVPNGGGFVLLVVDNRPLQRAAWAELHSARKRLDKVSRELHRHEEIDVPAYETWLHRTFPLLVTRLRQLHQEVLQKSYQVDLVQAMNYATGRSLKKLWREVKEGKTQDEGFEAGDIPDDPLEDEGEQRGQAEDWGDLFDEADRDERDQDSREARGSSGQASDRRTPPRASSANGRAAKDIYRRLVQRLHPDRGGDWTQARQRLWHEVQQAWASGNIDWLTRLEVEWETLNDVLGPHTPLGRLRQAIEELQGARRDIESKLRDYRGTFPWRFTLSEKNRATLSRRTEVNFKHDLRYLQHQLDHLNATIAAWERAPRPAQPVKRRRETRASQSTARERRDRWGGGR